MRLLALAPALALALALVGLEELAVRALHEELQVRALALSTPRSAAPCGAADERALAAAGAVSAVGARRESGQRRARAMRALPRTRDTYVKAGRYEVGRSLML